MQESYFWIIFVIVFVAGLALDLFVFQRKAHIIPLREALKLVGFWVAIAVAFGVAVIIYLGHEKGILFSTAYLVEYSLSIDNLFVPGSQFCKCPDDVFFVIHVFGFVKCSCRILL